MTLLIVIIAILGLLLISTEKLTNINKAAVAIFTGTLCWVLYICYGADFVLSQHSTDYHSFLGGAVATSVTVKQYIASNIFLKCVGRSAEIVLYLLATMTIVQVLDNNGCFDFLKQLLRTRSGKRMLWMLSVITFVLSINLDNLTTTVMMLTIMHDVVIRQRQRVLLGCAIVISANCGGAFTVIGDPSGIVLWNMGAVTATNFSASMALPCLIAWLVPIFWIGRQLPTRIETQWIVLPYRGDDTRLKVWQRLVMLFVGIGGLWFIPTFHSITKLSPFLGALCVLCVLWIVNEIVNRKLMNADEMIQRRVPRVLQYGVIQMMLFVLGIMLIVGFVKETGVAAQMAQAADRYMGNVLVLGFFTQMLSSVLDSFMSLMTMVSMHDVADGVQNVLYAQNGAFWKMMAYASAVGGNIFCIGSVTGLALMKMERIPLGWYAKNVGMVAFLAATAGLVAMYFIVA